MGDGDDGIVVSIFDVRELFIPVISEVVDDHCQHLGHRMVHTFHPTVAVWVVGAGGNFSNPEKLIYGVRKLGAELEAVVREDAARAPPERNIPVDENVSRALSGELCRSDGVHVGSAAETISEKQDVGISSRRHRERAEKVDADGDAGSFSQEQCDGGPPDRLPRRFPCLALQAVSLSPPGADAPTDPPVEETFEHT